MLALAALHTNNNNPLLQIVDEPRKPIEYPHVSPQILLESPLERGDEIEYEVKNSNNVVSICQTYSDVMGAVEATLRGNDNERTLRRTPTEPLFRSIENCGQSIIQTKTQS